MFVLHVQTWVDVSARPSGVGCNRNHVFVLQPEEIIAHNPRLHRRRNVLGGVRALCGWVMSVLLCREDMDMACGATDNAPQSRPCAHVRTHHSDCGTAGMHHIEAVKIMICFMHI